MADLHVKTRVNLHTHADLYVKTRVLDDVWGPFWEASGDIHVKTRVNMHEYTVLYVKTRVNRCLLCVKTHVNHNGFLIGNVYFFISLTDVVRHGTTSLTISYDVVRHG